MSDSQAVRLTLVAGELVAESAVVPVGADDGGEFGLVKHA